MITPHRSITSESLCGTGTVLSGHTPVATVHYWLDVRHAMPNIRSSSDTHVCDGPTDIGGRIQILVGGLPEAFEDTKLFVLRLEDGRQMPFYPERIGSTVMIKAADDLR